MTLLALPVAIIPMILFMVIVRRLDRYDPEPMWLLLLHFFWGAFGAVILSSIVNAKLIALFWGKELAASGNTPKLAAVFIGPVVEELLKAVVFILTVRLRDFNNLTDGIVYGASVGFGFAMSENVVYFIRASGSDNLLQFILYRTFFSGMMHAISCATFAAILGFAQFKYGRVQTKYVLMAFVPSIILHMSFNFLVSTESVSILGLVLIAIAFTALTLTFMRSLRFEQKYIREELTKEWQEGLLAQQYIELPFKRRQTKREYQQALICVQIAFERLTARHFTAQNQVKESQLILQELHKTLKKLETA
jgi:RsiW-degrading membrane proteinase PrsW (M82 family)